MFFVTELDRDLARFRPSIAPGALAVRE